MSRQYRAPAFLSCGLLFTTFFTPSCAFAQDYNYSLNDFGVTGLLQMPSARLASDDAAWFSLTQANPYRHWSVGAKFTPWMEVAFRQTERLGGPVCQNSCMHDYWSRALSLGRGQQVGRSLDVKLLLSRESAKWPAISVGFQDMFGQGKFRGEYIVASKRKGPLDLTFGLGWGYLGSMTDMGNPLRLFDDGFDYRSQDVVGEEKKAHKDWFSGQAIGFFGGIEYQTALKGLSLKAEWSSIDPTNSYEPVSRKRSFPVGFGVNWTAKKWISSGLAFEDGNRVMFRLSLSADLTRSLQPKPKYSFAAVSRAAKENAVLQSQNNPQDRLFERLSAEGYVIAAHGFDADGMYLNIVGSKTIAPLNVASIVFSTFTSSVQRLDLSINGGEVYVITRSMVSGNALKTGPAYKALETTQEKPPVIQQLVTQFPAYSTVVDAALGAALSGDAAMDGDARLVDVAVSDLGIELASISFVRAQLGKFDKGLITGSELLSGSRIDAGPNKDDRTAFGGGDRLKWSVGPELEQQLGGDAIMKADIFARARASLSMGRGLSINVGARQRIAGNLDTLTQPATDAEFPVIRGDLVSYLDQGAPMVDRMTISMTKALGDHLFMRGEAGIFDGQFNAAGAELLYMPSDTLWAAAGELYYARKRVAGAMFGSESYTVATGHISLYRELPAYAVTAKISAGRYLGGDWGMTLDLTREFDSGIRLGVYTTLTDASKNNSIENNFVKGAYLSVPLNLFLGSERGAPFRFDFRKLLRNAGQKLSTGRSLYETLQHGREWRIRQSWPK